MIADLPTAIHTQDLTRYFHQHRVVDGLNFAVPTGRVTALLGLNGAGKTTAIRMIMGLVCPTRGHATVLGQNSQQMPPEHLARIGYLVEGHYLPGWMRVSEIESLCRDIQPRWDHHRFAQIVEHFAIDRRQRCGQISRGQRAGVSLASVLAADPELLILDDPALGLDPVSRRALNETLLEFIAVNEAESTQATPRTVLLSTHHLDDVERIADDVAVMIDGRLLVHTDLADFQLRVSRFEIQFTGESISDETTEIVRRQVSGLVEIRPIGNRLQICVADAADDLADRLANVTGGDIEMIATTLSDRVIAYLSLQRSSRFDHPLPSHVHSEPTRS